LPEVLDERVLIVRAIRRIGASMTATRVGDDVKAIAEPWREVIEDVWRVRESMDQDHVRSDPAPIQIIEMDAVDFDEG
jgi:hypothetical protein